MGLGLEPNPATSGEETYDSQKTVMLFYVFSLLSDSLMR